MSNKFSDLTDAEIDQRVELIINPSSPLVYLTNYCNSWADTGPLTVNEFWHVEYIKDHVQITIVDKMGVPTGLVVNAENENLLRAICECILLINDFQNGKSSEVSK